MPLYVVFYLFILGICILVYLISPAIIQTIPGIALNDWMIVNSKLEKTRKGSDYCLNDGAIRTFTWRY
jgi:hypothetical protein